MQKADGSTLRQQLELFEKMSKESHPKLVLKDIPYPCIRAYDAWAKIYRGEYIMFTEIDAYCRVMQDELTPREIAAIIEFGKAAVNTVHTIRTKESQMAVSKKEQQ